MPESDIRTAAVGGRREGRRSHAAYGSHARGSRLLDKATRIARRAPWDRKAKGGTRDAGDWTAGTALAAVFPLVRRSSSRIAVQREPAGAELPQTSGGEGTGCMKRKPTIKSLETVSLEEAAAYLEHAGGDELDAAYALACDRNRLDGSIAPPDDAEVHHALFLLCRAHGKLPPSFDEMRVELRRRVAA
jgi:hypothetical protein